MLNLTLFEAMGSAKDEYVASAARLLGYAKEDDIMDFNKTVKVRKLSRTMLIAAVIAGILVISALAAYFAFSYRVPAADETFRIHWEDNPNGYLDFRGVTLAVSFPDTAVSQEIDFRPGWLPEEMASLQTGEWLTWLTAEQLALPGTPNFVPAYEDMWPPMRIETYSMAQFSQGGAMLLQDAVPGAIVQEHWDARNVDVMRFHTVKHIPAKPEHNQPAQTLEQDYVLLCSVDQGWIVRICGQIGMDQLLEIARNLEIRPTGKTVTYEDFTDHYVLFNGGAG